MDGVGQCLTNKRSHQLEPGSECGHRLPQASWQQQQATTVGCRAGVACVLGQKQLFGSPLLFTVWLKELGWKESKRVVLAIVNIF